MGTCGKAQKLSLELCDGRERWDGGSGRQAQEGGDICTHTAD